MVRTIIKAETNTLEVSVPDDFIGKEVEIIAFTLEEGGIKSSISKAVTFTNPMLDTTGFRFNRDEANER